MGEGGGGGDYLRRTRSCVYPVAAPQSRGSIVWRQYLALRYHIWKNNNDSKLKWYNTNKIVMQENNVDTFIFFGWLSTLMELARLVVMFPIWFDASRSNIIWNWYHNGRIFCIYPIRWPIRTRHVIHGYRTYMRMFEHVCFNTMGRERII